MMLTWTCGSIDVKHLSTSSSTGTLVSSCSVHQPFFILTFDRTRSNAEAVTIVDIHLFILPWFVYISSFSAAVED